MNKAISLFGKMLSFSRLKIHSDDMQTLQAAINDLMQNSPKGVPVLIDSDVALDLAQCLDILWQAGLQPIGVSDGVLSEQARALRLAIFPAEGKRIERIRPRRDDDGERAGVAVPAHSTQSAPQSAPQAAPQSAPQAAEAQTEQDLAAAGMTGITHTQIVRSGQSLQHIGGDLTVVGSVNDGAEVITDNNLHIYGRALGRLVAGATGDKDARIFCQRFNPSLVSVAGTYCLREAIPAEMLDQAVQVSYDEQKGLVFTLLDDL
ncbi:septum site-determining protein MinC [Moraxella caviae]|uniref:Probable septum site-determining protein MinC n=1 Tax=Moraxella caviae TaxID=34060 RepID=A0A1T0ADX5_9GAMM|nr:septum site-determining protein MinC [Moraxella caviae]OOR93511.1 septum site-determining protein MinC [Moraxella caviae]STZ10345.1 Septum site-determining protein MinC [Moraxella caviae]VEW14198.1 Septum site-determining protein MinC [Moraxella caviae]